MRSVLTGTQVPIFPKERTSIYNILNRYYTAKGFFEKINNEIGVVGDVGDVGDGDVVGDVGDVGVVVGEVIEKINNKGDVILKSSLFPENYINLRGNKKKNVDLKIRKMGFNPVVEWATLQNISKSEEPIK